MTEGQGFARRVTEDTLERYAPLLHRIGDEGTDGADTEAGGQEADPDAANEETRPDPERAEAESLFAGTSLSVSVPFGRPPRRSPGVRSGGKAAAAALEGARGEAGAPPTTQGRLLWRKGLSPSDAQRPPGSGSSPTGNLRLAQAGFEAEGKRIDQTRYFRYDVFGELDWEQDGDREDAWADFSVRILGRDYGVRRLRISHNPDREADQNNVTTTLHWGDLGETLRSELDLRGRSFSLYGLPPGQDSPFFIEIT